jgi:hypothetical protein
LIVHHYYLLLIPTRDYTHKAINIVLTCRDA